MNLINIITYTSYSIEAFGVLIIVLGALIATYRFLVQYKQAHDGSAYKIYRQTLGRSIILGLEFLIAGDIISTVLVAESLENVLVLGMIILMRSFLSITLHLEIEGRWPWQREED